jgi:hypothetical protein
MKTYEVRSSETKLFQGFAIAAALIANLVNTRAADPRVDSWFTGNSGKYARIYTSTANRTTGISTTTWTGQTFPAYAGVQAIYSSPNWTYIKTTGLGGHTMGPWSNPNLPKNQGTLYRFPRTPAVPANRTLTGLGAIGFFVDGVAIFNTSDGFSYSYSNAKDATPVGGIGPGDGIWNRDAWPNELVSFDNALAHNPQNGQYHAHANPIATRYFVGDNVIFNGTPDNNSPKTYSENTSTTVFKHSPIVGWAADGYPVYGPYGYDVAMDASSTIRRMISGYVLRDGNYGTTNQYNVRYCVTPEFPGGTYAYFVTIKADGSPVYPYNIGRWYFGTPSGSTTTLSESVTTNFVGGANSALRINTPRISSGIVTLTWSATEGGTYRVESTTNCTTWTTNTTAIPAVLNQGSITNSMTTQQFFRVARTAIASYDTN